MNKEKDNQPEEKQETQKTSGNQERSQRPGAFNEREQGKEKSTINPEEEADLEQQRKDALTERD